MSGLRIVGIAGAGVVLLVVVLIGAAAVALVSVLTGGAVIPSASATTVIPSSMLTLYGQAAVTCPGLPWTVLAAIGTVESDNGQSTLPGVHSGANSAGAEVIYRWVGGLRHVRDSVLGRRAGPARRGGASFSL